MPKSWWDRSTFSTRRPNLRVRAKAISAIREYFDGLGFIEVETPAIQLSPGVDRHIRPVRVSLESPFGDSKIERFLHTSPELAMKKLLAAGEEKIFQICHVFRNKEEGMLHQPEFTMLEWYRADASYAALIEDVQGLVSYAAAVAGIVTLRHGEHVTQVNQTWRKVFVDQAFKQYAGIELLPSVSEHEAFLPAPFIEKARLAGVHCSEDDQWDDVFHRVMMEKIEPELAKGPPVLLIDFPAPLGALARTKPSDSRICERVEAYICGLELANGFSELTDSVEQRSRFERDQIAFCNLYGTPPPIDEGFLEALKHVPDSAGMALGIDRLVMLLTGSDDINDVLWSPVNLDP